MNNQDKNTYVKQQITTTLLELLKEKESCTMQSLPVDPFPYRLCYPEHALYTEA